MQTTTFIECAHCSSLIFWQKAYCNNPAQWVHADEAEHPDCYGPGTHGTHAEPKFEVCKCGRDIYFDGDADRGHGWMHVDHNGAPLRDGAGDPACEERPMDYGDPFGFPRSESATVTA